MVVWKLAGLVLAVLLGALPESSIAQVGEQTEPLFPSPKEDKLYLPPSEGPVEVEFRFHLLNLQSIHDESEVFEFSAVLTLVWRDTRQAFDPDVSGVPAVFYHGSYQFNELSPGWYPQVVLTNSVGVPSVQGVLLRIDPDGTSTLTQMINATARADLELYQFPFDSQRMAAVFDVMGFGSDEVALVPLGQHRLIGGTYSAMEAHRSLG